MKSELQCESNSRYFLNRHLVRNISESMYKALVGVLQYK